jgi:AraC-like DNA-binding protein
MLGVPASFDSPADRAEFTRAPGRPGVELYRAHIVHHAFEPHAHAAFGFGVIEAGCERFRLRGSDRLAPQGSLVLMNPDELHTGRAETAGGWRYRMAYVDEALWTALSGRRGAWFDDSVVQDPRRAARAGALLQTLWTAAQADEPLAFDSALLELVQLLQPLARDGHHDEPGTPGPRFDAVIACMRARLAERLTLAELAAVAGLSPFHFLRRFKAQHHATPQQLLMGLRLLAAKARLAAGEAPADVAAAVGLADQAHLTRAFARRYGVTPALYARQVRAGRGTGRAQAGTRQALR